MSNFLAYNKTADELRTSTYAYNQNTATFQPLQLNAVGELLVAADFNFPNTLLTVAGEVTVANTMLTVAGDVTVANTLLTVSGEVTVTNTLLTVAGDVTVANTMLTVAGDVTVANTLLTVSGEVTVVNTLLTVSGEVTIANSLLPIFLEGNRFTSSVQRLEGVTGTGIALAATDVSQIKTATMVVDNTGTNPITVSLQLSLDGIKYFNNPSFTNRAVNGAASTIMIVNLFAQYSQIVYNAGALATFSVYYNGQV